MSNKYVMDLEDRVKFLESLLDVTTPVLCTIVTDWEIMIANCNIAEVAHKMAHNYITSHTPLEHQLDREARRVGYMKHGEPTDNC